MLLLTDGSPATINYPYDCSVKTIHVRVGQAIKKGALVATLSEVAQVAAGRSSKLLTFFTFFSPSSLHSLSRKISKITRCQWYFVFFCFLFNLYLVALAKTVDLLDFNWLEDAQQEFLRYTTNGEYIKADKKVESFENFIIR